MKKTLTIKKIYFDAILNGTKRTEYRAVKPYYAWLENVSLPFALRLHYQQRRSLTVTVKGVRRIPRPKRINPLIISTPYVWALSLGQIISRPH